MCFYCLLDVYMVMLLVFFLDHILYWSDHPNHSNSGDNPGVLADSCDDCRQRMGMYLFQVGYLLVVR